MRSMEGRLVARPCNLPAKRFEHAVGLFALLGKFRQHRLEIGPAYLFFGLGGQAPARW
jgi:hypothetical protein